MRSAYRSMRLCRINDWISSPLPSVTAEFDLTYSGFLTVGAGSVWISAPTAFDDQCCP
jgi:hypothetical protein